MCSPCEEYHAYMLGHCSDKKMRPEEQTLLTVQILLCFSGTGLQVPRLYVFVSHVSCLLVGIIIVDLVSLDVWILYLP